MGSLRIRSAPAALGSGPTTEDATADGARFAAEITEENLEDLLAYDDLFLDYFNAFLSLPVFAQPLYYNRLTGTFTEVNGSSNPLSGSVVRPETPLYGATDDERERMLEWAREERLPLFLRTQLFREFKLCKLLLRPLDDRGSASRLSSRQLRGYSRQTESYASSLSNSADNSANDADLEDEGWGEIRRSALYRYARPGSRAFSLPARIGLPRTFSYSASSTTATSKDVSDQEYQPLSVGSAKNPRRQELVTQNTTTEDSGSGATVPPAKPSRDGTSVSFHPETKYTEATSESNPRSHKSSRKSDTRSGQRSGQRSGSREGQRSGSAQRSSSRSGQLSASKSGSRSGQQRSGSRSGRRSGLSNGSRGPTPVASGKTTPVMSDKENSAPTTQNGDTDGTVVDPTNPPPGFLPDFDAAFGEDEPEPKAEPYVAFAVDVISDVQTEADVKTLEGKHRMTLQQMKEQVLGNFDGMEQFRAFLCNVLGGHLLAFWLDCEEFKDTMEDFDEEEVMLTRSRLFRGIRDKHSLSLTVEAKSQLAHAASNSGLSHTIFIRAQYDVLRRLRAYWVPRFLVHKERMDELSVELRPEVYMDAEQQMTAAEKSQCTSFFPSISLVSSMPVRPEDAMQIAKTTSWEMVSKGGRGLDERVKSAKPQFRRRPLEQNLREKLILALVADKAAGGPFRTFLERHQDDQLLSILSFWEDVTEYGQAEDRSADRLLRMVRAWDIYNMYVSQDSRQSIGVSPEERDKLHQILLTSKDFVDSAIFEGAKEQAVDTLEVAWIRFLKEDMKAFIDCQIRSSEPPPGTAEDIEVYYDNTGTGRLIVRRPWVMRTQSPHHRDGCHGDVQYYDEDEWYPPSTSSERGQRLRTALSMAESIDDVRRAELRRKAKERRKITERERRKAVRNARRRQREAKRNNVSFQGHQGSADGSAKGRTGGGSGRIDEGNEEYDTEGGGGGDGGVDQQEEQQPPTLQESMANRQVMSVFKRYMSETEGRETTNCLNLFLDIGTYLTIPENSKGAKQKKDTQSHYIHKTYLDQGAKKKVLMSDRVNTRLKQEHNRPRTPTLKDIQQSLQPQLEEQFQNFYEATAEELGLGDSQSMANLSKIELAMRSTNMTSFRSRGGRGKSGSSSGSGSRHTGSGRSGRSGRSRHATPPDPYASETSNIPQSILKLNYSSQDFKMAKKKHNVQISEHATSRDGRPETGVEDSPQDTPSESRQQSRQRKKTDGRAQPTKEDKVEFMIQLNNAAMGHLPLRMLYFYKYLVKYGQGSGAKLVDKDLFFYCEVQKFKACNHAFCDEEMLKRKVMSIVDCFLDSHPPPALQIDVPAEVHQKAVRASQRYLAAKDVNAQLFDEAQFCVFKELLPYWAGFAKTYKKPGDETQRPLTKLEKERLERLQEMLSYTPPEAKKVSLPKIPRGSTVAAMTFTLNEGIKWRGEEDGGSLIDGAAADRSGSQADSQVSRRESSVAGSVRARRLSMASTISGLGGQQAAKVS